MCDRSQTVSPLVFRLRGSFDATVVQPTVDLMCEVLCGQEHQHEQT